MITDVVDRKNPRTHTINGSVYMYRVTPLRVISLLATNSPSQSFQIPNQLNIVDKRCHQEAEELVQEAMEEELVEEEAMEEDGAEVKEEAMGEEEAEVEQEVVGGPTHHPQQRIPLITHRSIY